MATTMGKASRLLSFTEISTALTCWARWDFSYGGRLAGDTLRPRETAPILSDGRAWGAGVAAWHSHQPQPQMGLEDLGPELWAHNALLTSLYDDVAEMREKGFDVDPARLLEQAESLGAILDHHMATTEPLPGLERMEEEINVPLLSRSGRRGSTRYRYHCYIDGHVEKDGHPWIVEFKLREGLTPVELIERAPQYRWYAWARRQALGWPGAIGVYVDERLKAAPKPARIVKAKRKGEGIDGMTVSHAVDQLTTPELYRQACAEYGVEPQAETVAALQARKWHQRVPLIFSPDQLDEAGKELTSVAQTIRDLDAGRLYPIRHGDSRHCRGCRFKAICLEPDNGFVVNSLFERRPPKRDLPAMVPA